MRSQERKPNRLACYDYSSDGWYFVTICTYNREEFFGEVVDGKMMLNEAGEIARRQWHWLQEQYPYVILDEFCVMPNHIHGIVQIDREMVFGDVHLEFSSRVESRLNPTEIKVKSLSELMGAFKTTSSKYIHEMPHFGSFSWQRSFYDHIIRNHQSFVSIQKYIRENPEKWSEDKDNPSNLS